jgi:hypothetical protein
MRKETFGNVRRRLAVLLLVLFVLSVTAATVDAKIDPSETYRIMSVNSCKVLDVSGASTNDGAQIIQYEWRGGENQKWSFIPLSGKDKGYYRIESASSGKCLDISGESKEAGAKLIQYTWHKGDNQKFKLTPISDDVYMIECKHSKMVLDVSGGSLDNSANIIQYTSHGRSNQQWFITVV